MTYPNLAFTNCNILLLKVKKIGEQNSHQYLHQNHNQDQIIHIPCNNPLFTLADFIFHIYKIHPCNSPFGFYHVEGSMLYQNDNFSFQLKNGDAPFPKGARKIRNIRIDSVFGLNKSLVLKIENDAKDQFIVEYILTGPPVSKRKYPVAEKLSEQLMEERKRQIINISREDFFNNEKKYSDPSKATYHLRKPRIIDLTEQVSITRNGIQFLSNIVMNMAGG